MILSWEAIPIASLSCCLSVGLDQYKIHWEGTRWTVEYREQEERESQVETRWRCLLNIAWAGVNRVTAGRRRGRGGGEQKAEPPPRLLLINTGKARWLISRALALGFYPDVGGDAERRYWANWTSFCMKIIVINSNFNALYFGYGTWWVSGCSLEFVG